MLSEVRKRAMDYLELFAKDPGRIITSDGEPPGIKSDRALFTKLTTYDHDTLKASWKLQAGKPKKERVIITTCNNFVSLYSKAVVFAGLGVIAPKLPERLGQLSREYAWVPAGAGKRPKPGDIVGHKGTNNHVCVSFQFYDDLWVSVDAGQGGPRFARVNGKEELVGGHDMIKCVQRTFSKTELLGWVDLDLYVSSEPRARQIEIQEHRTHKAHTDRMWLNSYGRVVHPDSPAGRGGHGNFRTPGPLHHDHSENELDHPGAPRAQGIVIDESGIRRKR